jgi:hypothetical protein
MASALAGLVANIWCIAIVYVTYQKLVVFTASVNRFDIALEIFVAEIVWIDLIQILSSSQQQLRSIFDFPKLQQ